MGPASSLRQQLLHTLEQPERSQPGSLRALIESLEREQPADLTRQADLLPGVWQLRWSSGRGPEQLLGPWTESLQALDPAQGRALNLLRLRGPAGLGGQITVLAAIKPIGPQRLSLRFVRGGWSGPCLGSRPFELQRNLRQSFSAWLDVTVLDQALRICRGSAGTVYALTRHPLALSAIPWPSESD
ncbi:PAP/fibrillin family protein [Cyanobium sp. Morenito 9A2]|uniref:PAP/fibrillin family protein n=1 Tax=Cyanobium sp. Morenito 9A2 TaxID=2823718 RepID=UPI0020CD2B33|nr:PAP/fibrillin family protein [Cyanobium sp. Morenito 9A2]MCP9850795.1 PAP fibrillin [Cyanobium sp. Morenito 9A2]